MALRSDWSGETCPIARSLDVVGDPWVMLILREAFLGKTRFDEFRRALGVADNVLSRRLSSMVEAGLLERVPYRDDDSRTRHEYRLTAAGDDLLPVVHALVLWGEKHTASPHRHKLGILHETCGKKSRTSDVCSNCGERLTADTVTWVRPWRYDRRTPLVREPAV